MWAKTHGEYRHNLQRRTMDVRPGAELADEVSPLSLTAARELAMSAQALQRRNSITAQHGSLERLASVASSDEGYLFLPTHAWAMGVSARHKGPTSTSQENLSSLHVSWEASPKPRRRSAPAVQPTAQSSLSTRLDLRSREVGGREGKQAREVYLFLRS